MAQLAELQQRVAEERVREQRRQEQEHAAQARALTSSLLYLQYQEQAMLEGRPCEGAGEGVRGGAGERTR